MGLAAAQVLEGGSHGHRGCLSPSRYDLRAVQGSWSGSDGQPVPTPPGLLFHAGVGEADEFFTISVWESQEFYDEFAPVFKQAMAGMGFDFGTPAKLPVHHMIDPPS